MAEGRWTEPTKAPSIDWTISAALENVERGGQNVAEVTNLEGAVRAWTVLEPENKAQAVLTIEHPIQLDGVATTSFSGATLATLAEHLPNFPQDR